MVAFLHPTPQDIWIDGLMTSKADHQAGERWLAWLALFTHGREIKPAYISGKSFSGLLPLGGVSSSANILQTNASEWAVPSDTKETRTPELCR